MKKMFIACLAIAVSAFSAAAFGAAGEYWEVTAKMEMKGMPFAMPATTTKVCMPLGEEKDPRRTMGEKADCEFTDIKTTGRTTKWKGKCIMDGETMNQVGEATYERDRAQSTMHLTGKSHGRDTDMTITSSSKRIGGSCDPKELEKKMQAQASAHEKASKDMMEKACDTSSFNAEGWIASSNQYIAPKPLCPGKKEAFCQAIRNDVPHDTRAYEALVIRENGPHNAAMPSITKTCNINLASIKKSLCKNKAQEGPQDFLDTNCPAEAKAFRELARKREACADRGYTSNEKMRKCMSGAMPKEAARSYSSSDDAISAKSSQEISPAEAALEGAKKLKGLFNF